MEQTEILSEARPLSRSQHGVVAITGGSSGIGRATAHRFADHGWDVGVIARDAAGLAETCDYVTRHGQRAAQAVADVTDSAALEAAAAAIESELGPITIWINNAGISFYGAFLDITEEEFRRVTDVTYMGMVNGTRVALRRMLPRNQGAIVNIGSAIAWRGAPLQTPYTGAKFAIRGFTEALRTELIHAGSAVHLSMVHPPSVNTPFFSHAGSRMDGEPAALPPVYEPEIIARAVHLAATTKRRHVNATSATVQIAAMNMLAPSFADWLFGMIGVRAQKTHSAHIAELRDPALFAPGRHLSSMRGPWPARRSSVQIWAEERRAKVVAAGLMGLVAGILLRGRRR